MKLVIVHYHLRPGGVRRVIEEASRALVASDALDISAIVLVSGEQPDVTWRDNFQNVVGRMAVEYFINPAFGYISEQKIPATRIASKIRSTVKMLIADRDEETVVWFHNPGLGRNLLLVRELGRVCDETGIPFIAHHHDWWFENRWQRWPEMKRCGFRTLDAVAKIIFSSVAGFAQASINSSDVKILSENCGAPVGWIPNPVTMPSPVPAVRVRAARTWLNEQLGTSAPAWILPCRLLRRKNIAEALLLTRWIRPDARLVTTGGVSSAEEQSYFKKIEAAAMKYDWPLCMAVMRGDESNKPTVSALIAASEVVMLTSVQEGFGLPFIEAASSRRPLIARRLPNVSPDLERFGFRFPYSYDDILIHPGLFDRDEECARQKKLMSKWSASLPRSCRQFVGSLPLLAAGASQPVPFSKLTLTAQIEVLAKSADESWALCAPLNHFLRRWRNEGAAKKLRVAPWPRGAKEWLGEKTYARNFATLVAKAKERRRVNPSDFLAQKSFIRQRLDSQHLFPLLLSSDT